MPNIICSSCDPFWNDILPGFCDIATVFIAAFNVYYIILLNNRKKEDSIIQNEANRKLSLLKTLILDSNMSIFYNSFTELDSIVAPLLDKNCDKSVFDNKIQDNFKKLDQNFLCYFLAIDVTLYNNLEAISDSCRDTLVSNIANEGFNLYVQKQYEDKIKSTISTCKRKMIEELFQYNGNNSKDSISH